MLSCRLVLVALLGVGLLVGVVLVGGGYNVSAVVGHLPPVRALLHFTMRNSVSMRADAVVPPDLDAEARVMAGAGHYDFVCRECHGAPGIERNAVARSLVPSPPHILHAIEDWQPQELFWIVRNGIKMTGMPAWPAPARDDEVWSVVAFLQRLPEMSQAEYRNAVMGPLAGAPVRPLHTELDAHIERCARCHGYDGRHTAHAVPRIDGLTRTYLAKALRAFADGRRASGIMQAQASAVPEAYLDELASYYARSGEDEYPRVGSSSLAARPPSPDDAGLGRRIAQEGIRGSFVPPCADCHGPASHPRAEAYPALAGQPAEYLEIQLRLFRRGQRGGSEFAGIMWHVAQGLEDEHIAAVARYYSQLDPAGDASAVASVGNTRARRLLEVGATPDRGDR